jgi:hypothetical protein
MISQELRSGGLDADACPSYEDESFYDALMVSFCYLDDSLAVSEADETAKSEDHVALGEYGCVFGREKSWL